MRRGDCEAFRAALLDGARDEGHAATCAACVRFAASLATTDAALAGAARAAGQAKLPTNLRARILAARGAAAAPPPRGRLLEFALRAAAVAAVLLAGWIVVPGSLEAAELAPPRIDLGALAPLPAPGGLPRLESLRDAPDLPEGAPWTLVGCAAVTLLGGGFAAARGRLR